MATALMIGPSDRLRPYRPEVRPREKGRKIGRCMRGAPLAIAALPPCWAEHLQLGMATGYAAEVAAPC